MNLVGNKVIFCVYSLLYFYFFAMTKHTKNLKMTIKNIINSFFTAQIKYKPNPIYIYIYIIEKYLYDTGKKTFANSFFKVSAYS